MKCTKEEKVVTVFAYCINDAQHRIEFDSDSVTLNAIYILKWGARFELPDSADGLSIRVKGRKATVNIGSDITFLVEKRKGSNIIQSQPKILKKPAKSESMVFFR